MPARFTQRLKTDEMEELILAVSMSNAKQTGDYLREFIDLINRHNEQGLKIKNITVLLSCFLQRHYIGYEAAKKSGEKWRVENEPYLKCLEQGGHYKITHWNEWVNNSDYVNAHAHVASLYESNDEFKTIIGNLVKRHAPKSDEASAKKYLFEECAVFLLLKNAHISYPSNELNAAVGFVTNYFKTDIHYHGYAFYSRAEARQLPPKKIPEATPSTRTTFICDEERTIKEEMLKLSSQLEKIGIVGKSKQVTFFKKVLSATPAMPAATSSREVFVP